MPSRPQKANESNLVRNILGALEARKVWAWRCNSGTLPVAKAGGGEYRVKQAPAGTPDILGVLPGGILFGLEAKVGRGVQSPSQRLWEAKAQLAGVRYRVVRSVPEALAALDEWGTACKVGTRGVGARAEQVGGVSNGR